MSLPFPLGSGCPGTRTLLPRALGTTCAFTSLHSLGAHAPTSSRSEVLLGLLVCRLSAQGTDQELNNTSGLHRRNESFGSKGEMAV